jgi:hypothetical protein
MDVFSQSPEAKPLCDHIASAIMLAAPATWQTAELEVQVTESPAGTTREYRIVSPQHRGQVLPAPDHVRELATELEQMYEGIGQRWGLFALTVKRVGDGFKVNTYVEFRG